jgi:TonB family protein
MFLPSMNESASENTPLYVFEIQQLFRREHLPVGTEYAMLAVADGLTKGTELRTNLERSLRAIIHREGGRINAMELLGLILMASASPVDPLPSERMERAMHETLGFILEVKQHLENSSEGELGAGLIRGKEGLPSWSEPLIMAGPPEKTSLRVRSRAMLAIALCGTLVAFFVVGLSRHRQQASENAGAQTRALSTSGSANRPDALAPVVSAAQGKQLPPSHNTRFRSKAKAPESEESETPRTPRSHTAPPIAVGTLALPNGERRLHSASASTNIALPSVSNSISRPREVLAGTTRPRIVTAADVSTAVVSPAISAGGTKPVAPARGFVQSGSAGIMAANLIWSPTPAYPAAASEAKVEGEVTVNALVGKDGNVLSARVVSGPPLLRDAALKAVEKWQYHPYLVSGKPAVIATTAIIDFELAHD